MPHAGVVLIPILLDIYLVYMSGLEPDGAQTARWINQLDLFAVVRIDAAVPGRFPLWLRYSLDEVEGLDKPPEWIGGAAGVEGGGADGENCQRKKLLRG